MGITIHYRGRLRDPDSLPELRPQLQLACQRLGWPCHVVDERVIGTAEQHTYHPDPHDDTVHVTVETTPLDDHWRGVLIQPPGCETLWLTFNRSGQLVVYDPPLEAPDTPGHYYARVHLWVKTQFSSPEVRISVCELLRLVERYAAEWEVVDEGDYWESGDREELAARMERLNAALAMLASDEGLEMLEEMLGREVRGPVEIGKRLERRMPFWRREWGISAEEN